MSKFLLNQLKKTSKDRIRVARGVGSGKGRTAGRGHKGYKARSGSSGFGQFEGGQTPFYRRLPKRGFNPLNKIQYQLLSTDLLLYYVSKNILNNDITFENLINVDICKGNLPIKILLGKKKFNVKISIETHQISKTALDAIESAGGSVKIVPVKEFKHSLVKSFKKDINKKPYVKKVFDKNKKNSKIKSNVSV